LIAGLVYVAPSHAQSQTARPVAWQPTFEVSSIRINRSNDLVMSFHYTPVGISIVGISLEGIVHSAFPGLHEASEEDQILGLPKWTKSERYDIQVKLNEADMPRWRKLAVDQQRLALLPLLVDRFNLRYHHELKIMPAYVLSIDNGGSKLKQSMVTGKDANGPHMFLPDEPGHLESHSTYMWELVDTLERQTGYIVLDQTGLEGSYDYTLHWTPDDQPPSDASGPSLSTALKEQLGIKLELQKKPMDVIVIDHIDHPSPN